MNFSVHKEMKECAVLFSLQSFNIGYIDVRHFLAPQIARRQAIWVIRCCPVHVIY